MNRYRQTVGRWKHNNRKRNTDKTSERLKETEVGKKGEGGSVREENMYLSGTNVGVI